jgi:hypothetical protein
MNLPCNARAALVGLLVLASAVESSAQSVESQAGSAPKVALEFLSFLGQGKTEDAARLEFQATAEFDQRSASLPSVVLGKIWAEQILPSFIQRYESNSKLADLLADSPRIEVLETKPVDDPISGQRRERVFLQLTYSSADAAPYDGPGTLQKAGLAVNLASPSAREGLKVVSILPVPELAEKWSSGGNVALCRLWQASMSQITCITTSRQKPQSAVVRSPAGETQARFDDGTGRLELSANCTTCRIQLEIVWSGASKETYDFAVVPPEGSGGLIPALWAERYYAREPWLTKKWNSQSFPWFARPAKLGWMRRAGGYAPENKPIEELREGTAPQGMTAQLPRAGDVVGAPVITPVSPASSAASAVAKSIDPGELLVIEATRTDYLAAEFPVQSRIITSPLEVVWQKMHDILAKSKDPIATEDRDKRLIVTALTKHGVFPVARYDRYSIALQKADDNSTKITLKALLYSPVVGKDSLIARPKERVLDQGAKLLDQLMK